MLCTLGTNEKIQSEKNALVKESGGLSIRVSDRSLRDQLFPQTSVASQAGRVLEEQAQTFLGV